MHDSITSALEIQISAFIVVNVYILYLKQGDVV